MINKTFLTVLLLNLVVFGSQAKADFVIDFRPGFDDDPLTTFEITTGPNFTGTVVENHTSGHTWTLDGTNGDPNKTIKIRYEFPSLQARIGPNNLSDDLVNFSVPLTTNASEGVFSVVGTAERASGGSYVFTDDSGGTPNNPTGDFEWVTSITMADLAADDIVALDFDVTFNYISGPGLNQTFTFGGPGGLIAAPEPTSAAMIGCVLMGLVARRRRKV